MATRANYRAALEDKLVALEDSGYGDFEFSPEEFNTYLDLAVTRLYPALYKRSVVEGETPAVYGTNRFSRLEFVDPEKVFLIVDSNEQEPIRGWRMVGSYLSNLDLQGLSGNVDVHYYEPYTLPLNDDDDAGIPASWTPVIVLGALIEALESRQDTGVRGDEPPVGNNVEIPLLDRLLSRYDVLREELALSLPVVTV